MEIQWKPKALKAFMAVFRRYERLLIWRRRMFRLKKLFKPPRGAWDTCGFCEGSARQLSPDGKGIEIPSLEACCRICPIGSPDAMEFAECGKHPTFVKPSLRDTVSPLGLYKRLRYLRSRCGFLFVGSTQKLENKSLKQAIVFSIAPKRKPPNGTKNKAGRNVKFP